MEILWTVIIICACLLFEAFFSGSEIGLVSADRIKLRHDAAKGSRGAKLALVETAANSPDRYKQLALIQPITNPNRHTYPYVMLANGWILVKDNNGKLAACSVGTPPAAKP